jgi:hypothetical protein
MSLTGRFTFRKTLTGKIVLQVEEDVKRLWKIGGRTSRRRWRDATTMDLAAPELRSLIDLRQRPQFTPPTHPNSAESEPADPKVVVELSSANGDLKARR